MTCEWPSCSREAEHEVHLRGAAAPLNVCGAHRIEYLRNGLPEKKKAKADVQPSEAAG